MLTNSNGKITGIIPGLVLIIFLIIFFIFINSSTNKSEENYSVLKDYMEAEEIKNSLNILTECGFTNYSLSRDDSLDNLDGENTLGFRIKTDNYNAILYLKDGVIKSIRFADNYLYNEGNYISTMQNYIK